MDTPPDALPRYRLLTGPDDAAFCRRVSEALDQGYQLYGSPTMAFNGVSMVVGQALVRAEDTPSVPQPGRRVGFLGI